MRRSFSSFCRLIAAFMVMTVLTSGIAMAAYACPQLVPAPAVEVAMKGMPCAEMDKEEPVLCAEQQSGIQLGLEHLAKTPGLGPIIVTSIIPAPLPVVSPVLATPWGNVPLVSGTDPPYFRTLRFRI